MIALMSLYRARFAPKLRELGGLYFDCPPVPWRY